MDQAQIEAVAEVQGPERNGPGLIWPTVAEFEGQAASLTPPLSSQEFADKLASLGLSVWYDAVANVIRAQRAEVQAIARKGDPG